MQHDKKICWLQKDIRYCPRIFFGPKLIWLRTNCGKKKFLSKKFCLKKFPNKNILLKKKLIKICNLVQNIFQSNKKFGPEQIWTKKCWFFIILVQKKIESKIFFGDEKNLSLKILVRNIFAQKNLFQKKFCPKKNFVFSKL